MQNLFFELTWLFYKSKKNLTGTFSDPLTKPLQNPFLRSLIQVKDAFFYSHSVLRIISFNTKNPSKVYIHQQQLRNMCTYY